MLQILFFKFILEFSIVYVIFFAMNELTEINYLFLENLILIMYSCNEIMELIKSWVDHFNFWFIGIYWYSIIGRV